MEQTPQVSQNRTILQGFGYNRTAVKSENDQSNERIVRQATKALEWYFYYTIVVTIFALIATSIHGYNLYSRGTIFFPLEKKYANCSPTTSTVNECQSVIELQKQCDKNTTGLYQEWHQCNQTIIDLQKKYNQNMTELEQIHGRTMTGCQTALTGCQTVLDERSRLYGEEHDKVTKDLYKCLAHKPGYDGEVNHKVISMVNVTTAEVRRNNEQLQKIINYTEKNDNSVLLSKIEGKIEEVLPIAHKDGQHTAAKAASCQGLKNRIEKSKEIWSLIFYPSTLTSKLLEEYKALECIE